MQEAAPGCLKLQLIIVISILITIIVIIILAIIVQPESFHHIILKVTTKNLEKRRVSDGPDASPDHIR